MEPTPTPAEPVLEIEGLAVSFGSKRVLRGIDLVVLRGETFALLGGSGSGKTVLLRSILGLDHPDGGRIRVFGRDVADLTDEDWEPLRKRMSIVFQGGALYGALTVAENVALVPRELLELPEKEIASRIDESLVAVGLADVDRELVPSSLSGGMKKRLAVARAIATHPDLILYDEPTSGLDPLNSSLVLALIRRLHDDRHVTSVVVTHDVAGACSIADRIGVLVEGRLVFIGTPAELLASQHPRVLPFLRLAGLSPAAKGTSPSLSAPPGSTAGRSVSERPSAPR